MKTKLLYEAPHASMHWIDGCDVVTLSVQERVGEVENTPWKTPKLPTGVQ